MEKYFEIIKPLNKELEQIDCLIQSMFQLDDNEIIDYIKNYLHSGSKKIRSVFILLILGTFFNKISKNQLKIMSFIEVIHNASLIHDDIIDNSLYRRGVKSMQNFYNPKIAVISGDYVISIVMQHALFDLNTVKNITSAIKKLCLGEISQFCNEGKFITLDEYIKKSEDKTASLFLAGIKSCLEIENISENKELITDLTKKFGIAFQIRDDLLDFMGNYNIEHKDLKKDIQNGIITAPIIYITEKIKEQEKVDNTANNCQQFIDKTSKNPDMLDFAVNKTKSLLNEYFDEIIKITEQYNTNVYSETLIKLCKFLKEV